MDILGVIILLFLSGLFSGLTISYMGLDIGNLNRLAKQGNKDAEKVLEVRSSGMRLLTTLILGTNLTNAFATVLIGDKFGSIIAGLLSTVLIFILADVFPQAFASSYALRFSAMCAPVAKFMLFIFYPFTQPVVFILKKILGEEKVSKFSKIDLLSLLDDNGKHGVAGVDHDERRIAKGSLLFSQRRASNVMTPNTVVKTIAHDQIITHEVLMELKDSGYSRIPVSADDPNHFIGILYLKDLIGIKTPTTVQETMDSTIHFVLATDPLDKVLAEFIETKMHLFVVLDEFGGFEGVITVEDILEEIIGQEIMDEDDVIPDLREFAKYKQKRKKS